MILGVVYLAISVNQNLINTVYENLHDAYPEVTQEYIAYIAGGFGVGCLVIGVLGLISAIFAGLSKSLVGEANRMTWVYIVSIITGVLASNAFALLAGIFSLIATRDIEIPHHPDIDYDNSVDNDSF